jgi:hypothetical protein
VLLWRREHTPQENIGIINPGVTVDREINAAPGEFEQWFRSELIMRIDEMLRLRCLGRPAALFDEITFDKFAFTWVAMESYGEYADLICLATLSPTIGRRVADWYVNSNFEIQLGGLFAPGQGTKGSYFVVYIKP